MNIICATIISHLFHLLHLHIRAGLDGRLAVRAWLRPPTAQPGLDCSPPVLDLTSAGIQTDGQREGILAS